jgi:hypothetical protein
MPVCLIRGEHAANAVLGDYPALSAVDTPNPP